MRLSGTVRRTVHTGRPGGVALRQERDAPGEAPTAFVYTRACGRH